MNVTAYAIADREDGKSPTILVRQIYPTSYEAHFAREYYNFDPEQFPIYEVEIRWKK